MGDSNETNVPAPTSKIYRTEAGTEVVRPIGEVAPGETEVSPAEHAAEGRDAARRDMFDNLGDGVLTFAEGVVDAASAGLIHEHGEAADIRRSVNSGAGFAGNMLGTVLGIEGGGPLKAIASGGRSAGQAAARIALGQAEGLAGKVATRALTTAAEGAAVMGAGAFGHQISDAIVEDKPFAMEVVAHEMGLGAVLSGAIGAASGLFSSAASGGTASRAAVESQGGLAKGIEAAPHVQSAIDGLDTALDAHAQHLGVLDVLSKEGHIPDAFMEERAAAYKEALKAQAKVRAITPEQALTHDNPAVYKKYRENLDDYQAKVAALDDSMRARTVETLKRQHLGEAQDVPGYEDAQKPFSPLEDATPEDSVTSQTKEVVESMRADPAKMADYEKQWGRSFDETDAAKEYDRVAEHNSPSPADGAVPNTAPDINAEHASTPVDVTNARPSRPTSVMAPEAEASGIEDSGSRFSDNTQAIRGARPIPRTDAAIEADNVLSSGTADLRRTAAILPDGHFLPAVDAEAYGNSYARFQDRMAQDTQAIRARKLASWKQAPVIEPIVPVAPVEGTNVLGSTDDLDSMVGHLDGTSGEGAHKVGNLDDLNKFIGFDPASVPDMVDHPTSPFLDPKDPGNLPKDHYVREYIRKWAEESNQMGPRVSPADRAAANIRQAMDALKESSGGRLTSAATLDLADKMGVHGATTPLGEMMDQAWTVKQAGRYAADEARGVKTPLGAAGRSGLKRWLAQRAVGMAGGAVAGPLGYVAAEALIGRYAGVSGKVAAAAGRMYQATIKAADSLLKGSRSTIAARAVAGNRPYQYSDRGAIADPIKRIQEIQRVAQHPDLIREKVTKAWGDFGAIQPDMASMAQDHAVNQVTQLSIRAPAIYMNQLGVAVNPAAGEMRKFLEYENATHSFEGVLGAVANGSVTRTQAQALREQWPEVHNKLVTQLLSNPEGFKKMDLAKLRTIELLTGYPLTPGADPAYVARQQAVWIDSKKQGGGDASKLKPPAPTDSQSQARAPGN